MTTVDRFGGALLAGTWDESLHPRDEKGRFGEGTGSPVALVDQEPIDPVATATQRIQAALPKAKVDIARLDPALASLVADHVEKVTGEFPRLANSIGVFAVDDVPGDNVGQVRGTGALHLSANPRYYGVPEPGSEDERWHSIFAVDQINPNYYPERGKGQASFHPVEGAAAYLDHELGHVLLNTAMLDVGVYGEGFTRWSLGKPPHATTPVSDPEYDYYTDKTPTRGITRAMRMMGSEYGAQSFTTPGRFLGVSGGPPSHEIDEGFADWFAMRQYDPKMAADRTPALLADAFDKIVEQAAGATSSGKTP